MITAKTQTTFPDLAQRLEWYWAVLSDPGLDSSAKVLASRIGLYHFNSKTGQCNPSAQTLAKALGRHVRGIDPALKALRAAGWISWTTEKGASNRYRLEQLPCDQEDTGSPGEVMQPTPVHPGSPLQPSTEGGLQPTAEGGMASTAEKPVTEPVIEPVTSPIAIASGDERQTSGSAGKKPKARTSVRIPSRGAPMPAVFDLTNERRSLMVSAGIRPDEMQGVLASFINHARDKGRYSFSWDAALSAWCQGHVARRPIPRVAATEPRRTSRYQIFSPAA